MWVKPTREMPPSELPSSWGPGNYSLPGLALDSLRTEP